MEAERTSRADCENRARSLRYSLDQDNARCVQEHDRNAIAPASKKMMLPAIMMTTFRRTLTIADTLARSTSRRYNVCMGDDHTPSVRTALDDLEAALFTRLDRMEANLIREFRESAMRIESIANSPEESQDLRG